MRFRAAKEWPLSASLNGTLMGDPLRHSQGIEYACAQPEAPSIDAVSVTDYWPMIVLSPVADDTLVICLSRAGGQKYTGFGHACNSTVHSQRRLLEPENHSKTELAGQMLRKPW